MKNTQNQYTTLTLTGSLFSNDMLSLMAQGQSSHQSVEDYKLLPGLRFSDEISRSFNIARALYNEYKRIRTESSAYDTTKKFIEEFFTKSLNYDSFINSSGKTIKDRTYPITLYAAKNVPIIIAPYTYELDTPDNRFTVDGVTSRKKSAFALAQLFLNASSECTWAFATNGLEVRLLRDSDSMVRPSYLSFDLEGILSDSRYPDFVALWYLIQASRVNFWESWRTEGITNGTRVREGLRDGVTNALLHLGAGFLKTEGEGNNALLNALKDGKRSDGTPYTQMDFYKALLREVYRFLFLSTIEERDLLFAHSTDETQLTPELRKAHKIYREGYSIHRLAEKSRRIPANDKYTDIWHGVQVVFKALQQGNAKLDLTPLGGLFRKDQCPLLDACNIDNEHLLKAIRQLRWCYINGSLTFTDYRNMGTEEFGSVYESLLELVPRVDLDSKLFSFVGIGDENGINEEGSTAGNARKTSGSYYTNADLVQSLIKSALEPGLMAKIARAETTAERTKEPVDYEKAILSFSVIDPACGSGHFLLAAARRIAEVLVEKRMEKMEDAVPSQDLYRKALRDVITNCIYGVDLNDMAVELTRTALWLEGYEPGKPLEFLSHHIKCGNSLVGVYDLNVLNSGIPDAAYAYLSGDEKDKCASLLKTNKEQVKNRFTANLFSSELATSSSELASLMWRINLGANDTIEDQENKIKLFEELHNNKDYIKNKIACDLYTAAFFAKKTEDNSNKIPTSEDIFDVQKDRPENTEKKGIREEALRLAEEHKFFHWKIEFPEIFQRGLGFDCILGNPPWDRVKLAEKEFFATRKPEIAEAKNKAARDKMIQALAKSDIQFERELYSLFINASHAADSTSAFVHYNEKTYKDCRYQLTGCGDVNMYALFAELIYQLKDTYGTAGFIVPSGISTDDGTKAYFGTIATSGLLKSLYDFENRDGIFPNVHRSFKFCLITLAPKDGLSDFCFFLHNMQELEDKRRHFTMLPEDFDLLNPNTHTCPVFRSDEDAKLAKKIYTKAGVFIKESDEENGNPWNVSFMRMFDMSNDSFLFVQSKTENYLPLYEAKMMHQFDHRWCSFKDGKPFDVCLEDKADVNYSVTPEYWVPYTETVLRTTLLDEKLNGLLKDAIYGKSERSLKKLEDALKERIQMSPGLFDDDNGQSDDGIDCKSILESGDIVKALFAEAENRCPRFLMGWRDITGSVNERTLLYTVIPFCGAGNTLQLTHFNSSIHEKLRACFLGDINSLIVDYCAKFKIGGNHMNLFVIKQIPIIPPFKYSQKDIEYIVPRIMALTYTAKDIVEWAKALWTDSSLKMRLKMLELNDERNSGITDEKFVDREFSETFLPPYIFDDTKRAVLRAELDAYYARLYGLTRQELQYILEPQSVMGEDYPSETFRVLKDNEIAKYGEYRTQRLVLEAWDKME